MLQNICRWPSKAFFKAFFSLSKYSTRSREPSIKFLGTRHPQPKFDPSAMSSIATSSASFGNAKTSTAPVKPAIDFTELPAKFRRKMISEEEIQVINSGVAIFGCPMSTDRLIYSGSPLSPICPSEIPSLISFLVDLCLERDSRVREQRSIACYILSKWTTEIESHPAIYSFLSNKHVTLSTSPTSLGIISPTKKRKMVTQPNQKRRQRSEVGRRRTKSGDGTAKMKRKESRRKSKSKKAISTDKLSDEHNGRLSQAVSASEGVLPHAPAKRQRSRRKSMAMANISKRPPSFSALAPKKTQSSHILIPQQQRPSTSHGIRPSSKYKSQTSDASNCITQFDGNCCNEKTKNHDDEGALRRLFSAVEMTKDESCLILLCRIICGYLRHCKKTESRRRLRECIRLDAVGCCLRALRSLLSGPNNEMNRIAEDTLAHTILCFSAKDRKFLLKVRLSGVVPMFVSRLPPSENANCCHDHSHHSHHFHAHNRSPHSLLPFSFSAHPTALFRLIAFAVLCQNDAENRQLPSLGSHAAIAKYSRQTETELTINYQKLFAELTKSTPSSENVFAQEKLSIASPVNTEYEAIARMLAQRAKGVIHFVKLAFPDLVDCPTDGDDGKTLLHFSSQEHTDEDENATKITNEGADDADTMKQMTETGHDDEFEKRVVFDLDQLAHSQSEPPLLLDNDDALKIGTPVGAHLLFESRFESGNLRKATQVSPNGYELVLAPDINQCGAHFQWFFFQVSDMRSGIPYTFEVVNCAKSFSMFSEGMQPVLFSVVEAVRYKNPCWSRVGSSICYFPNPKLEHDLATPNNDDISADFQVDSVSSRTRSSNQSGETSFTSTPSVAGNDLSSKMQLRRQQTEKNNTQQKEEAEHSLDGKQSKGKTKKTRTASAHKIAAEKGDGKRNFFTLRFTIQFPHEADVCYIAYHFPYTYSRLQATLERFFSSSSSHNIYMHRQRLTSTLCSNPVPLLTITAAPLEVKCREFVLITARVHPGEANSSWIMHGVISFLLSSHPLAVRARELFIFKLVPMLNPDGVINGCQRCSLSGHDLNRVWNDPSPALHPTIYHAKGLLQYMDDLAKKRPFAFVDLHGHSRKSNVFMYGNNLEESWRQSDRDAAVDTSAVFRQSFALLPQILDEISDSFALKDCAFSITKAKEFSARVTTCRQFGIEHAYTMESTYCGFDQGSKIGRQIKMDDMKLVGADLVKAMVKLWETQQQMHPTDS
ncbi:hypothetical protein niasHT_020278 [Heterodera trifolii]|uniref:Peptidase M14 domain-containing protein n=1 Tax=Heterodera trifolii TaxID=157864 RepID=A0ABD2JQI1_9BILA